MTKAPRLTKDDWLAAGFRALATEGPGALRAEALARALGTTKGSFYWHFSDLPDFKAQMLELWQRKVAGEIMAEVARAPTPAARLASLIDRASQEAPEAYGGRAIEPAIRAWALSDPSVAAALARVDRQRIDFLDGLMAENGATDPALPAAIYAAYIGLDDLASKGAAEMRPALVALIRAVLPD